MTPLDSHSAHSLWLELTPLCNWSCLFCYNSWRPKGPPSYPRSLPYADLCAGITGILDVMPVEYVALSGGEPLLYPALDELISVISGRDVYSVLTTNGSLLTARRTAELRALGLSAIQVSLMSADEETHDKLAARPSWQAAVAGIVRALDHGFDVSVVFTANRRNIAGLFALARFLNELGVPRLLVNRLHEVGSAPQHHEGLALDLREYEHAVRVMLARTREFNVRLEPVPPLEPRYESCAPGWHRLSMAPDGLLKLCNMSSNGVAYVQDLTRRQVQSLVRDLALGNIEQYSESVDSCSCFEDRIRKGRLSSLT